MAINAYVLVRTEAGRIKEIAEKVSQIGGVKTAHACWGQPDIFAYVEAEDQNDLSELVLSEIQSVEGVVSTDTHIVVQF